MVETFATSATGLLLEPGTVTFKYTIPLIETIAGNIETMPEIIATMTIQGDVMILMFRFVDNPSKVFSIAHRLGQTTIDTIIPAMLPYSLNYDNKGPADFIITIGRTFNLQAPYVIGQYVYTFQMVHEDTPPLFSRFLVPIILGKKVITFEGAITGTRTNSTRVSLPNKTILVE